MEKKDWSNLPIVEGRQGPLGTCPRGRSKGKDNASGMVITENLSNSRRSVKAQRKKKKENDYLGPHVIRSRTQPPRGGREIKVG